MEPVDSDVKLGGFVGNLTPQFGHAPAAYYAAEPTEAGGGGANGSDATHWRNLQQARAGFRTEAGGGLLVTAGLFLSPIGPESMAARDDWSFSRSNLFYGLPFYHVGARGQLTLDGHWALTLAVYNGWNDVVDNNDGKSVSVQANYGADGLAASLLYFGGNERARGAPEGEPWRHLLDAHATAALSESWEGQLHLDAGFEPNDFGTSAWAAGALAARYHLAVPLYLAVRGDYFREHVADGASPIFWPVDWVASGTLTLDWRPVSQASVRLELRHDQAEDEMFFEGAALSDHQDTVTLALIGWL